MVLDAGLHPWSSSLGGGYSASTRSTRRRPRCFVPRRYRRSPQGQRRKGDGEAGGGATSPDRDAASRTLPPMAVPASRSRRVLFPLDLDNHSTHSRSPSPRYTPRPSRVSPGTRAIYPRYEAPRLRARTADAAWRGGQCFRGLWRAGSGRGRGWRSGGRFGMTSAVELTGDGGRAGGTW